MRALKLASALGATACMLCVLTSASGAQQKARQRAPIIQVSSASGADIINTSTYVEPRIRLSEDAFVFAVMTDLDGQIQVLHPDFPGLSVKISGRRPLQLPNFFSGFNRTAERGSVYSTAQLRRYNPYGGYMDTRGTVLALASRVPFNLERIESGGDWNISAIRRLIEDRTPQEAMSQLANYLGAQDEPIGRDYMRFAGGGTNYQYAYSDYAYYSPCNAYYGYASSPVFGFATLQAFNRLSRARGVGRNARVIGWDLCGMPIISYVPVTGLPFPGPGNPQNPGDTTVFPKAHLPRGQMPRHPPTAAQGVFPIPSRSGLGQAGDVTITAPTGLRAEPRQIIERYRVPPGTMTVPQGRKPVDYSVPVRTPGAASGSQPARTSRPEPLVAAPPPSRMPDRASPPPPAPTPVVRERPSVPSSPPPKPATTETKSPPSRK